MARFENEPTEDGLKRFGNYLKSERDRLDLRQADLVERLQSFGIDINIHRLSRYEKGDVEKIPANFIWALERLQIFMVRDRPLTVHDCHEMTCDRNPPKLPPTLPELETAPSNALFAGATEFLWETLVYQRSPSDLARLTGLDVAEVQSLLAGAAPTLEQLIKIGVGRLLTQSELMTLAKMYEIAPEILPTEAVLGGTPVSGDTATALRENQGNVMRTGSTAVMTKRKSEEAAEILRRKIGRDISAASDTTGLSTQRLKELLEGEYPSVKEQYGLGRILEEQDWEAYFNAFRDDPQQP